MANEMIEKLKRFLDSDEGKLSMQRFAEKMLRQRIVRDRWVLKFKNRYENNLDIALEKLMNKYYSDEYRDREHKIGCEPREPLLWLVWDYAEDYCKPYKGKKYANMFTHSAYHVGSYIIQLMNGQGSILRIDKK
jgi:hypothetical protein